MPLKRGKCTKEDCGKPHRARGLCSTHYKAWSDGRLREDARAVREKNPRPCKHCGGPIPATRTATAIFCGPICKRKDQYEREKTWPEPKQGKPCSVDGCGSATFARSLCAKHYTRLRSKGTLDDTRKNARGVCSVDGCTRAHLCGGVCDMHYRRQRAEKRKEEMLAARESRMCAQCGAPIPIERSSMALFCSVKCKKIERRISGQSGEISRRHYFSRQYGLTPSQVDEMAEAGCAICGTLKWTGRHKGPHVDHDHATGAVRGILCHECNTALGKFRDDPAVLERAIAYLLKAERAKGSQTVLV